MRKGEGRGAELMIFLKGFRSKINFFFRGGALELVIFFTENLNENKKNFFFVVSFLNFF